MDGICHRLFTGSSSPSFIGRMILARSVVDRILSSLCDFSAITDISISRVLVICIKSSWNDLKSFDAGTDAKNIALKDMKTRGL